MFDIGRCGEMYMGLIFVDLGRCEEIYSRLILVDLGIPPFILPPSSPLNITARPVLRYFLWMLASGPSNQLNTRHVLTV